MIVSEIYSGSGLGNQIWNLVVPRIVAEKYGYKWGVKKSNPFKASHFLPNIDFGEEVTGGSGPEGGPPTQLPDGIVNYYKERVDNYPHQMGGGHDAQVFDNFLWNQLPDNTKIDGCFQKIGYIQDRKDDIIEWLRPNLEVTDYSDDNICVIHFRGGEYLTTASWCPPEYYANASDIMLQINPNMKFFVVTDDPEEAKKYIPWASVIGSSTMNEKDPYGEMQGTGFYKYQGGPISVDYSILNNAKYAIISASTFSFWPCWTNTKLKEIIAPRYWFDYKTSNGWWRGDDMIVDSWLYLDQEGSAIEGCECKVQYDQYRKTNPFYQSL